MSPSIRKPPLIQEGELEWVSFILESTGIVLDAAQDVATVVGLPFVSTAVTLLKTIIDTTQAVRDNKVTYQEMEEDALSLVATIVRSCASHKGTSPWPPSELESDIESIMNVLTETCRFVEGQNSRNMFKRIGKSKADVEEIKKRRMKIRNVLDNLQVAFQITTSSKLSQVFSVQMATKDDAVSATRNSDQSKALQQLANNMASGASHDSYAQADVPPCFEDTRNDEIDRAITWLQDAENQRPALWVRSSAGFGKTALAQTLCKMAMESGHLGASFFWSRSDVRRPTTNKEFVATIVYQLCHLKLDSTFTDSVVREILNNPAIFDKALPVQMERLMIQPLLADLASSKKSSSDLPQSMLVVADGVDECEGVENQKAVLKILLDAVQKEGLPLRILMLSRNEHAIRNTLESASSNGIVEIMDLHNDHSGVKIYMISEFNLIKETMTNDGIPFNAHWPSDDDLDKLLERADGVFIFASVVMKYIASEDDHPVSKLRAILSSPSFEGSTTAFSQLDQLYGHILAHIPSNTKGKARDILLCCAFDESPTIEGIDALFRFEPGSTRLVLRHLSSVIKYHKDYDSIQLSFFHASFREFLTNQERLGDLANNFWYSDSKAIQTLKCRYLEYYQLQDWRPEYHSLNRIIFPVQRIIHLHVVSLRCKDVSILSNSHHLGNAAEDENSRVPVTDLTGFDLERYFIGYDAMELLWWWRLHEGVEIVQEIMKHQALLYDLYVKIIGSLKKILRDGLLKLPVELQPYILPLLDCCDMVKEAPETTSGRYIIEGRCLLLKTDVWLKIPELRQIDIIRSLCNDPSTAMYSGSSTEEMYAQLAIWLFKNLLTGPESQTSYNILFAWVDIPSLLNHVLGKASKINPELKRYISDMMTENIFESELLKNDKIKIDFDISSNVGRYALLLQLEDKLRRQMGSLKESCEYYLVESRIEVDGFEPVLPITACAEIDPSNDTPIYNSSSISDKVEVDETSKEEKSTLDLPVEPFMNEISPHSSETSVNEAPTNETIEQDVKEPETFHADVTATQTLLQEVSHTQSYMWMWAALPLFLVAWMIKALY